jgi:hypothetical protein
MNKPWLSAPHHRLKNGTKQPGKVKLKGPRPVK